MWPQKQQTLPCILDAQFWYFSMCPGVRENSIDSLVFDTLIPKTIMQRYLNLLLEHRRIILSGPSGTGKSYLACKLAEFLVTKSGHQVTERNVVSFNVDHKSSKVGEPGARKGAVPHGPAPNLRESRLWMP